MGGRRVADTGFLDRDRAGVVAFARSVMVSGDAVGLAAIGDPGVGVNRVVDDVVSDLSEESPVVWMPSVVGFEPTSRGALALMFPGIPDDAPSAIDHVRRCHPGRRPVAAVRNTSSMDTDSIDALVALAHAGCVRVVLGIDRDVPSSIAEALRIGLIERLDVEALDPAGADALAESLAGGRLDQRSRRLLASIARGRPPVIEAVVTAARRGELLDLAADGYSLRHIPSTDPAVVGVASECRAVHGQPALELLSVIAALEPVTETELTMIGLGAADAALAELLAAATVVIDEDGDHQALRVVDPLVGLVAKASLQANERRRLRRTVTARSARPDQLRPDDLVRTASWAVEGDAAIDASELVQASRASVRVGRPDLAARIADTAFEIDPDFSTGLCRAIALAAAGDVGRFRTHVDHVATHLAATDLDRAKLGRIDAMTSFWDGADPKAVDRLAAMTTTVEDPAALASLHAVLASLMVSSGRIVEGLELAEPVVDRIDLSPGVAAAALAAVRIGHAYGGRPLTAISVVEDALADTASPYQSRDDLAGTLVATLAMAGRAEESAAAERTALQIATDRGSPELTGDLMYTIGSTHLDFGRVEQAEVFLAEATRWADVTQRPSLRRWALVARCYASAVTGALGSARRLLDEIDGNRPHPASLNESFDWRARAWISYQEGLPAEHAVSLLIDGATQAAANGNVLEQLECLVDLVRIAPDHAEPAIEAAAGLQVEGDFLEGQLRFIEAVGSQREADMIDAIDAVRAGGADYLAIDLMLSASRGAASRGSADVAARLAGRAGDLRRLAGVAATVSPGRIGLQDLSDRELEVALAAAAGLTSRQIGERLFINTRTVDSHLGRIYRKLGVGSRGELRALLDGIS